jgi:hypothetical protein
MEFYENGGGAVAKLFWSYPGQARQIIPSSRLSAASAARAVALSDDFKSGIFGYDVNKTMTALTGAHWRGGPRLEEANTNGINGDVFVLPESFVK